MREKPSVLTSLSQTTMKGMRENMAKRKPVPPKKAKSEAPPTGGKPLPEKYVQNVEQRKETLAKAKELKRPKEFTIEVEVFQGAGRLTVEKAKELIGWTVVGPSSKGQKGTGDSYTGPFHCRDVEGNKILLANNATNRPFRPGLAKRYGNDMLRRKWFLNGESIVFDWRGQCQSGQHRLVGFIMAEEMRRKGAAGDSRYAWIARHWKGPIVIDALVVRGISDESQVIDSIDQGQKRTLGDVIYRAELFGDPKDLGPMGDAKVIASDATMRKLANILGGAARLVWLRAGGRTVSTAPHFPVSEAMEFISSHEKLKDIVLAVFNLDGGTKMGGGKISRYLPMGYASGLWYLMAVSGSDPEAYELGVRDGRGAESLDFSMETNAKLFWEKLASGLNMTDGDPIYVVREALRGMDKGSADSRDEVVGMIIKAFNLWLDGVDKKGEYKGRKVTPKDLKVRRIPDDQGRLKLAEDPRLGGIDIEGKDNDEEIIDDFVDEVPEDDERASSGKKSGKGSLGKGIGSGGAKVEKYRPEQDEREGHKEGKQWAEGDTCWVKPPKGADVPPYFGTVQQFIKSEAKGEPDSVNILDDNGDEWNEPVTQLSLKYPG